MKRMLHFPETALSTRIARFALLSLAAHLALLATWEHPALLSGQHDSILSVSLSDATVGFFHARSVPETGSAVIAGAGVDFRETVSHVQFSISR